MVSRSLCWPRTMFPGSRNVPNVPDVPNVSNNVPNIPGHGGQDGLLAEGYVAKISMLRLNVGSGMLRLSSCMLSVGLGPKAVQGKGGEAPLGLFAFWSEANAEHA